MIGGALLELLNWRRSNEDLLRGNLGAVPTKGAGGVYTTGL